MKSCSVPHCGRWQHKDDPNLTEWICDRHWRLTDLAMRKKYRTAVRSECHHVAAEIWNKLKKQAIERSHGI